MKRIAFACVIASSAVACTAHVTTTSTQPPPTSSTLATNEMWPSMSAQSDGQFLHVYAALLKGSTFVDLDTGDFFTASIAGGDAIVLVKEPDTPGKIHYTTSVAAPSAEVDVVIALHRPQGMVSAATSHVTVAAPFSVTTPIAASFRHGDPMSFTIAPPPAVANNGAQGMTLDFSGTCIEAVGPFPLAFDASGKATFDTGKIVFANGPHTCDVTVQIRHETSGPGDPAYQSRQTVEGLFARTFSSSIF
jgi:hypothetical protein